MALKRFQTIHFCKGPFDKTPVKGRLHNRKFRFPLHEHGRIFRLQFAILCEQSLEKTSAHVACKNAAQEIGIFQRIDEDRKC